MEKASIGVGHIMKMLVVHGWAYDVSKWQGFMEALAARGINAQLLKVPGLSTPLESAWGVDEYVAWLAQNIGNEPAIIIGHSNGGRIALHLAAKRPELVARLILIDSAGIPRRDLAAVTKRIAFKHIAKTGKKLTNHGLARKVLYKLARQRDYLEAPPLMREVMANLLESDYSFDPSKVSVPTDIIWGSDDKITPIALGKELKAKIPNARLYLIDGARHSPQYTHADQVADIVKEITSSESI